jgi:hypothetical protein
MQSRFYAVVALALALALPAACSGGGGDRAPGTGGSGPGIGGAGGGDRRLFVPEGLTNTNVDGADVGLVLVAFTLVPGPTGPALYAAVRNDYPTPVCNGGLITTFLDKSGYVFASAGAGLQGGGFYQNTDGTILTCIEPGEIAMAASPSLPDTIVIDQIGSLQHQMPAFVFDGLVAIGRLPVSGVAVVPTAAGSAYTGTMTDGLTTTVSSPSVSVFPLNAVGRPLGVATASATVAVAAGGTWTFETTAVADPGVATAAFATASMQ